jgi:glyoxylase-like metal-dependent hydrolase (beta-lactamase superfamily II)
MAKPFASTGDTSEKTEKMEVLADGVYALTAEGDPNVGAFEGEDFLVCFDARATPATANAWMAKVREFTDKPVKYLVLTHYHAVRVLGASAMEAENIVASRPTAKLIEERGTEDWDSEFGRMPRLFKRPEQIPGLTLPTQVIDEDLKIDLGGDRGVLEVRFCGRGHTAGDLVGWHPKSKTLFAGDLVEAEAALYTGDAFHFDWSTKTLDALKAFRSENLIGGRGAVAKGVEATDAAIEQTRAFLRGLIEHVGAAHKAGGTVKDAFDRTREGLGPTYGRWPIFDHVLPFDVQRVWDEHEGIDWPRIWTSERDHQVWDQLQD